MSGEPVVLTREAILSRDDLRREPVEVPEWGGEVYVRELTVREVAELTAALPAEDDKTSGRFRAAVVAFTACDPQGKRLFTADDIDGLAGKAAGPLERVFKAADGLNVFTDAAREDAAKNSPGAGDGSSSGSP